MTDMTLSQPVALRYLRDQGVHPDAAEDVLGTVPVAAHWTGEDGPGAYYYLKDLDAAVAFVRKD